MLRIPKPEMQREILFPGTENQSPRQYSTGVLPSQDIEQFIAAGYISANTSIASEQIQPASLDLRLGSVAYRVQASFLPGPHSSVERKLNALKMYEVDLTGGAVLERGCVFIAVLQETLNLPEKYSGLGTPKSTTGRLDVFTRLITDYGDAFEKVRDGYRGQLYLEISPRTFSIIVRQGDRLNQLRIRRGAPVASDALLKRLHDKEPLVVSGSSQPERPMISKGLWLSVNLRERDVPGPFAYRARPHAPLLDFSKTNFYDPNDFWEPIYKVPPKGIILNPDDFYLFTSKENIRVPPEAAAEMIPFDTSLGEFRVHYAGFFDPGFGYDQENLSGTNAVLEVRSHEVPVLLEDGQRIGRLLYERLLCMPDKVYGAAIGSSYTSQVLALSKQFKHG